MCVCVFAFVPLAAGSEFIVLAWNSGSLSSAHYWLNGCKCFGDWASSVSWSLFWVLVSDTTWHLFLEGATSWPCGFMVLCDSEWCTGLGWVSPSHGNIMCMFQPLGSGKNGMSRFTRVFNIHVWWNYLGLLCWSLVCLTSNWNAPGLSPCTYFVFYPNSLTLWCHPVPWP